MDSEYTFDMILDEVCRLDFEEFNSPLRHRFSLRNRIRINKLFSQYTNNICQNAVSPKKINRRFVIAAVIIIMLATLTVTVAAVMIINGFIQKQYSDSVQLFAEYVDDCPTTIEEIYYLSALPDEYIYWDGCVTDTIVCSVYTKGEDLLDTLSLTQTVKSLFQSHFNDESYTLKPITINGHNGVFVDYSTETKASSCIVWDNGDYILELLVYLPKEQAVNIAKSAKVLEK